MHAFRLFKGRLTHWFVALVLNALVASAAYAQDAPIDLSGVFHPGEPGQVAWRVIKPAQWTHERSVSVSSPSIV